MSVQIFDKYICVKCKSAMKTINDHKIKGYEVLILVICPNKECQNGVLIYD